MSDLHEVLSPLPGTAYLRSSPDEPRFIEVGKRVETGDTLMLIEVMKMFNPVPSDVSGVVKEILVESEDAVMPAQPLVRIEVD